MRTKKIIIAIIIFLFIEASAFMYINFLHKVGMKHYLLERTKDLVIKQKAVQNTYSLMVENVLHQSIESPEILQLFSQAQFADSLKKIRLRDSLHEMMLPVYNYLKSSNIKQLHFHLPNNESFLRFHKPEKYGDNLTDIRYSVKMTNQNKKSYHGFEEGRIYNGFRNVFPLFYDSLHIGSVETSFSFEAIRKQLLQHENVMYGFMIKKEIIAKKVFDSEQSSYIKSSISDDYMYEKKYIHSQNENRELINQIDNSLRNKIGERLEISENFTISRKINEDYYLISFVSINNVEGLPAAYLFSYKKDQTIIKYEKNNFLTQLVTAILIAFIAFFMLFALLKTDRVKEIDSDYKDILDANSDVVFMVNIFGKQLYFNKQVETLLGYERERVIGKMFTKFIPASEIPKYLGKLKEIFLSKELTPFETFSLHKDGSLIPVEIAGKIITYNGETVGVGTIRDISDRKKTEAKIAEQNEEYAAINEELRQNLEELTVSNEQIERQFKYIEESEAEYRAIIDSTTEGYWLVNLENNTIDVNESICKMLGYSRDEMLGKSLVDFLDDKNKEILKLSIIRVREKNITQYELSFQSKKGENIPVIINSSSLKDEKGNKTKSFAFITDIRSRKKEEQSLLESREHLKKAQEAGKIGSWEWNVKKNEIVWSEMTFEIFGIKQNSNMVTSEQYFERIYPEDKSQLIKKLDDAIENKEIKHKAQYRILREDEIVWISESAEIITNENGELVKMIGILQDITEQQKKEHKIRQLSTVVEQSPSTIVITDISGAIEYVNSAFTKSTGYTFDEAKGENPRILKAEGTDLSVYENLWKTIEQGKTWNGEFLNISKNGEKYWEQAIISSIKNDENEIINYLAIKYDITERKIAEEELKQAKQEAEKANRLKSEFLANMSHEIRTPMNSIIGFSSILQRQLKDEKLKSFANRIANSGNNLINLINDILDLSKIEAGQLEIHKEEANLYDTLNEIPLFFSEIVERKQLKLSVIIEKKLPNSLKIDAFRIRQILLNLVGNALKFTEKGSVSVIVTANKTSKVFKTLEVSVLDLIIEVKDTGIGIPENELETIFYSFRQVEGQSTKKYGGTGLGLSISKRLAELMGGEILVKSTVNVGSTFSIILKNVEISDVEYEEILQEESLNVIFNKQKILHVEDVEYNRELISLFLEDKNIELKEAFTGIEALEILKTYTPDLILMDIQMPKLNGYETAKIIRKNKFFEKIPIIAITANATKEEIEKYSSAFDEYLTKPVDEDLFLKLITKHLEYKKEKEKKKNEKLTNCIDQLKKEKNFSKEFEIVLLEEIKPLQKELLEIFNFDELKKFTGKVANIGEKYNTQGLKSYSKELQAAIDNFNLDNINKLLHDFSKMLEIVKHTSK